MSRRSSGECGCNVKSRNAVNVEHAHASMQTPDTELDLDALVDRQPFALGRCRDRREPPNVAALHSLRCGGWRSGNDRAPSLLTSQNSFVRRHFHRAQLSNSFRSQHRPRSLHEKGAAHSASQTCSQRARRRAPDALRRDLKAFADAFTGETRCATRSQRSRRRTPDALRRDVQRSA